jgi:sulfatase modifying factor 1
MVSAASAALALVAACSAGSTGETSGHEAGTPGDGAVDGTLDAHGDTSHDALPDTVHDREVGEDAPRDAGVDAGCVPGTVRCSGTASIQTCSADGTWELAWPCASGSCTAGACTQPALTVAASCAAGGDGLSNCGEAGVESCCTSLEVAGGTYYRSYGSLPDGGPTGESYPATVSGLRLDAYDVTVGRFRQFVSTIRSSDAGLPDGAPSESGAPDAASDGGADAGPSDGGSFALSWVPDAGSGKHAHLNGGQGLVNAGGSGGYEPGWVATDDDNLTPSDSNLESCAPFSTWTDPASTTENLPISCVNWYEAYAFCIWDGGFLPSQAEWEFAAAGGGGPTGQREYPWGAAPPGTANQYAIYGCLYPAASDAGCTGVINVAPVGSAPLGAGAWGQLDLGGNVYQWNLDWYATFTDPCLDCADLAPATTGRIIHGGDFFHTAALLTPSSLYDLAPADRNYFVGFRCARTP